MNSQWHWSTRDLPTLRQGESGTHGVIIHSLHHLVNNKFQGRGRHGIKLCKAPGEHTRLLWSISNLGSYKTVLAKLLEQNQKKKNIKIAWGKEAGRSRKKVGGRIYKIYSVHVWKCRRTKFTCEHLTLPVDNIKYCNQVEQWLHVKLPWEVLHGDYDVSMMTMEPQFNSHLPLEIQNKKRRKNETSKLQKIPSKQMKRTQ